MATRALPVLAGIVAVLCARRARADDPPCSGLATDAEASVSARWPGLLGTVRQAFAGRDDIDRCARVKLRSRDGIAVEVVLPDGRFASRAVSRPEDVVPTLEALLLLPRPQRDAPSPPPPAMDSRSDSGPSTGALSDIQRAPSPRTQDVPIDRSESPVEHDALPSSALPPSRFRIELSVATGARFGDNQTSLGLGVLSFLDLSGWLVGFEGRLDRYQRIGALNEGQGAPDGASAALELAVLGGRRVRFDGLALDFVVGPAAAVQGTTTSTSQTQAAPGTTPPEPSVVKQSSSTAPRLLAISRLNFAAQSTLHAFVGIDGEIGPPRVGPDVIAGAPRLPTWTLGLALGATVGTR